MKPGAGILACGVAAMATLSAALSQTSGDASFVRQAAAGNEQEIRDARLQLRSGSTGVRNYAQLMIDDHSLAMVKLRAAARNAHVSLPATPPMVQPAAMVMNAPQGQNSTAARDYFRVQVSDHRQMLTLLQREASGSGAPSLKQWAAAQIPVVERHLALAEDRLQGIPNATNGAATTRSGSGGASGAFGTQPGQGSPAVNGTPLPNGPVSTSPAPSPTRSASVNPTPTPVSTNPP